MILNLFGDFAEEVERRRVAEPRLGNGAVGGLRGGELTNHFGFGASMGKHIDEIEHADIELVILDLREVLNESFAECRFVDFIVRECISFAEPVEQCLNEGSLVQVFPSSSSSSTHRSGNMRAIWLGSKPEKIALRAYCVAVGRILK